MNTHPVFHLVVTLVLLAFIQACDRIPPAPETKALSPIETSIVTASMPTTVPAQATVTESLAPPTATQKPTPIPPTSTPQPTSTAVDVGPTQTALAPIVGELTLYGIDAQQGQPGWILPTLSVELEQRKSSKFENTFPEVTAKDFVLASDITWESKYGGIGCAFVFHSDGEQEAPSQYMVIASRLADGHIVFAVMAGGQLIVGKDFYAKSIDPKFNADSGATNRLAVVGQGTTFTIYLNGTKVGEASPNDPPAPPRLPEKPVKGSSFGQTQPIDVVYYRKAIKKYEEQVKKLMDDYNQRVALWSTVDKDFASGSTALGVITESGGGVCQFSNTWLWLVGTPGQ